MTLDAPSLSAVLSLSLEPSSLLSTGGPDGGWLIGPRATARVSDKPLERNDCRPAINLAQLIITGRYDTYNHLLANQCFQKLREIANSPFSNSASRVYLDQVLPLGEETSAEHANGLKDFSDQGWSGFVLSYVHLRF